MTVRHTFEVPKLIGMKTAAPSKQGVSKGTGNERVFNRLVSNVENDLSQLDSTESEGDANAKMLVDAATSNARLTMQSYEEIDRLRAENKRLLEENKKLIEEQQNNMTSVSLNGSLNKSQQSFTINNKRKSSPVNAALIITYSDL
jgi:hypothetical protein